MNDIKYSIRNCSHLLYADDIVIHITGNINVKTDFFQNDPNIFKGWCDINQLTMNTKKTKYVTFELKSQKRKVQNHDLFI